MLKAKAWWRRGSNQEHRSWWALGPFSEMLPSITMGTREGEHFWGTPQYAGRPLVQSQEAKCVARAAPTSQISAAVCTVANECRLQVSFQHWINERIHLGEENLSAWADRSALKSASFTHADADGARRGSGHRQSLASKAAFVKLRKEPFETQPRCRQG